VLGAALKGRRDRVVIATKFGNTYDETTKELTGGDASPAYVRRACEASLRRLGTDWIDLYQLHLGDLPPEEAEAVAEALEGLCDEGLIRGYGWSTDDPARAALFAGRPRALAVQHAMNVLSPVPGMLALCRREGLAGIVRSPLAMGLLSGKYGAESRLPADDIRAGPPDWLAYFREGGGAAPEMLARLEAIREVLTSEGRSLVQGALAWIWASAKTAIPIPGFRREDQVRELSAARAAGVARVLVSGGQDPRTIRVQSYGEHDPVADNATAEGRARNRRVELFFSRNDIRDTALRLQGSVAADAG